MSGTRLRIAAVAKETGALLTQYLKDRNIWDPHAEGVVCYGYPTGSRDKTINGVGTGGKINSLSLMEAAGVRTVPWFSAGDPIPANFRFPALARKNHGYGGTDILPVFQPKDVEWRIANGADWFSTYIPLETEYRVWIFRGEVLDTYEKVMKRPSEYGYIGRNFRNGFDFGLVKNQPDATREAVAALNAINYDFGAVDLLRGEDGLIYILEVNSAPGVIKSGAQATLGKFADRIETWVKGGYN